MKRKLISSALALSLTACAHMNLALERSGWISGEERRKEFIAANPELTAQEQLLIGSGNVIAGMSPKAAVGSWGPPYEINRSTGSWGVHEQWVYKRGNYSHKYLYFENGKLTSWQD